MSGDVPNDEIARLIRAALEADAKDVDVLGIESRVCEQLAQHGGDFVAQQKSRFLAALIRRTSLRVSLAAACLLVIGGVASYLLFSASPVQAYALVRSAQAALNTNTDREYIITIEHAAGLPILSSLDEARLWTRGDRYRVEFTRGDNHVLWGKDEQRRVWVVSAADKGLSFESKEIPPEVNALLSYLSLDLKHLTDQILRDCELTFSEGMQNQRKGVKTIDAIPKQKGNMVEFSAAQIDIDESNKAIRRLELSRRVNGTERGRCRFVLISEAPQTDASYRLESYLVDNATVLDKAEYYDRMVELFRIIREFPKK
ncbi:MAG TPA: hypothetical protein VGN12_16580 [Pirellulales bacterium]|jgi:hypothetical protein